MNSPHLLSAFALCISLTACTSVGPNYGGPPTMDTGSGWSQPIESEPEVAAIDRWWIGLEDPTLNTLISTALSDNLDLRKAMARIQESRALRDRSAGASAPAVSAGAGVTRREQSLNGPLPVAAIPSLERTQTIHDVGFDASWELDLFGRTRRSVESAEAMLQASQADADGMRMSIAAEVARNYFALRCVQQEFDAHSALVETLNESLNLVQQRAALGDAALSEVDAAQAALATASAELPRLHANLRALALSIGVMLGQPPESGLALLDSQPPQLNLPAVNPGMRSDILRRRPDVIAAERLLAARTAEIGVATAELFPKLSFGASGGFQSLDSGNLFNSGSRTFSLTPLLSWRIFDGGRVRAEIHASESREQQAAFAYEKAVLTALADAERALGDYQLGLDALNQQFTALQAMQSRYDMALARYKAGDISLSELLMQERQLHEQRTAFARSHATSASHLVALYKALGGGWDAAALEPTRQ